MPSGGNKTASGGRLYSEPGRTRTARRKPAVVNVWDECRRRRNLVWLLGIGYLPAVLIIGSLLNAVLGNQGGFVAVAAAWLLAFGWAVYRLDKFCCPRCGKPFFRRGLAGNTWSNCCLHCAWPRWQECHASDREAWRAEEEVKCLRCGATMDAESQVCPVCGWSYESQDE